MKSYKIYIYYLLSFIFQSCDGQIDKIQDCKKTCNDALRSVYSGPDTNKVKDLDKALYLVTECLKCDSQNKAAVEMKIVLYLQKKMFQEGVKFLDSIKETNFTYSIRKQILVNYFIASKYNNENKIKSRDSVFQEMTNDLKKFTKTLDFNSTQFDDAFNDYFDIRNNYTNKEVINSEIDSLIKEYPQKASFFLFYKEK